MRIKRSSIYSAAVAVVVAGLALPAAPAGAIIGGSDAPDDPAIMAARLIAPDGSFVCSATAVRANVTLTAGHCLAPLPATKAAKAAAIDLGWFAKDWEHNPARMLTGGEGWSISYGDDVETAESVAIVRVLSTPFRWEPFEDARGNVVMADYVAVITEPIAGFDSPAHVLPVPPVGTPLTQYGFGVTALPATLPDHLQAASTTVQPPIVSPGGPFKDEMLTTGGACYGDSGAPSVRKVAGHSFVVGLMSRGIGFGDADCPARNDISTSLDYHWQDILRQLRKAGLDPGTPGVYPVPVAS